MKVIKGGALCWLVGLAVLAAAAPAFAQDDASGDVERGKQVYERSCAMCHGPGLHGRRLLPGTAALQVKYGGKLPAVLDERTNLSAAYVERVVRRGLEGMPFFRPTEVTNQELRDLAAYLSRNTRNLR